MDDDRGVATPGNAKSPRSGALDRGGTLPLHFIPAVREHADDERQQSELVKNFSTAAHSSRCFSSISFEEIETGTRTRLDFARKFDASRGTVVGCYSRRESRTLLEIISFNRNPKCSGVKSKRQESRGDTENGWQYLRVFLPFRMSNRISTRR